MRTWFRNLLQASGPRRPVRRASCRPRIESLEDRHLLSSVFVQTRLISDIPGFAPNTNPNFINPWQFIETPTGQFRVAANGSGRAILIDAQGEKSGADIMIPPPAGSPSGTTSAPTGAISNTTPGFVISSGTEAGPASELFATEDGTISGWNPVVDQKNAILAVDNSQQTYPGGFTGAVYKGLAEASTTDGKTFIYATNFRSGNVDVFDSAFAPVDLGPKAFKDPKIPKGFAPFGIQAINGKLYVTYAMQDAAHHDDVAGPGNGFVDVYDPNGILIQRVASRGFLDSPWGETVAPAGFGQFGGDLLVGNFGDSHVSAFDPVTGQFLGQLTGMGGKPLILNGGFQETTNTKGLWGINFGNGAGGAGTNTLFFAAGINDEADGLFGKVDVASSGNDPAPATVAPLSGVMGLHVASSPQIAGQLLATAAIADNDIWAVDSVITSSGQMATLTKHWDGTS